jgi:hypothetical protein
MHRVRQSLPYFKDYGWEAEVVAVDPAFIESYSNDNLLLKTIPAEIKVHYVNAWQVSKTRKFGLGSLSMRSWFHYRKKGNELLASGRFDLVFFSTTAFHVMALGPYWKKKFNIPFVLDIQDPWRNDFYLSKPQKERPPKFIVAYNIDKFLEARTVPEADAIISVSMAYCDTFRARYPRMKALCSVIPFGGVPGDFAIAVNEQVHISKVKLDEKRINIVYVGRGGHDMRFCLELFFKAFAKGLQNEQDLFSQVHCWFIGTSYAKEGSGTKTVAPIAAASGVDSYVTEVTDRIPYFETLMLLKKADVLFVPGSTDTGYTASKIYPYILAEKPLLACFHQNSSIHEILKASSVARVISFQSGEEISDRLVDEMLGHLTWLLHNRKEPVHYNRDGFRPYTASAMTARVIDVFNGVVQHV